MIHFGPMAQYRMMSLTGSPIASKIDGVVSVAEVVLLNFRGFRVPQRQKISTGQSKRSARRKAGDKALSE